MTDIAQDQFDELKDRVDALQHFLLAHVIAADTLNRTLGDDTLAIAQKDVVTLGGNRPLAAAFLNAMVDAVLQVREATRGIVD